VNGFPFESVDPMRASEADVHLKSVGSMTRDRQLIVSSIALFFFAPASHLRQSYAFYAVSKR
jgi:hypothetical protein